MTLQPGDIIEGKYRIVRQLGQGGMGAVYEGDNTRIHRRVAIKVLHSSVAAKADVVQRFEREAQAAGRIGSEHIVEVLDLGNLPTGERFMVMEYLEGESLGQRIKKRKRLAPTEAAPIIHGLLEGLAAAHDAGIVHRDLKPDNVYLVNTKNQRDFVKVLDFGVSKFSALDNDMSMTKTGAVMGTPYYMSPEQARGGKIDHRSDLYSVGVVMYQAVTGRLPFKAETFNELVFKIALESPEPAEVVVPNLDPGFAALIAKAMVRDAGLRFQTAREFQAAVAQWMMSNPIAPDVMPGGMNRIPTLQPGMFDPRMSQQNPLVGTGPLGFDPRMSQQSPMVAPGQHGFDPRMSQQQHVAMPLGPGGVPLSASQMAQLSMSQAGQLGMSQAGLTMTAPAPRGNGAMIAIGLLSTLLVATGGLFAYKFVLQKPPVAAVTTSAPAATAPAPPPPPPTAPTAISAPTAATTTAATSTPTAQPLPTAATAPTVPGPMPTGVRTGGVPTGGSTVKKPPPTPTATSKGGGRTIGSDL
ncbi:serine/threonine-protein kinase [Polyangium aurulentum]|uniref:serine/threonine-protein kinase n=1 Tax=Polyangium aurulentum TaxID=2567896 RepID=UPI0010AE2674|nr:serine/threonine-protein kinase [Polyangium aurulentum]UQA61225.1 protein kinase [Polyangium aurulentum]